MVDLCACFSPFFVDGRDFDLEHEADRVGVTGLWQLFSDLAFDLGLQPEQAGLCWNKLFPDFRNPSWMGEITGPDQRNTFFCSPIGCMLQISVLARRPRIFRVDVQIRVKTHALVFPAGFFVQSDRGTLVFATSQGFPTIGD